MNARREALSGRQNTGGPEENSNITFTISSSRLQESVSELHPTIEAQAARRAYFGDLPDGVQLSCYMAAFEHVECAVLEAAWFLRSLGGQDIDLRLCFGAVVILFTQKYGEPL